MKLSRRSSCGWSKKQKNIMSVSGEATFQSLCNTSKATVKFINRFFISFNIPLSLTPYLQDSFCLFLSLNLTVFLRSSTSAYADSTMTCSFLSTPLFVVVFFFLSLLPSTSFVGLSFKIKCFHPLQHTFYSQSHTHLP